MRVFLTLEFATTKVIPSFTHVPLRYISGSPRNVVTQAWSRGSVLVIRSNRYVYYFPLLSALRTHYYFGLAASVLSKFACSSTTGRRKSLKRLQADSGPTIFGEETTHDHFNCVYFSCCAREFGIVISKNHFLHFALFVLYCKSVCQKACAVILKV